MDDINGSRGGVRFTASGLVSATEQERVLPVPPLDDLIVPDHRSQRVEYSVTKLGEDFGPI